MDRYVQGFCYIFGDDPDVVRIITSFTSSRHWDRNTKPFESPLIIESGGLFGFNKRPHRVENQLERSIFAVLERLQKLEFYDTLVQQLRAYMINIRFFIGITERVAELNVSQKQLESFITDVRGDFECLIKRFVYFYLMNLDDDTIKSWFTFVRRAYDQYEREVLTMVQSIRDSTSDCCGKFARNCSMTCNCHQHHEGRSDELPQKKRRKLTNEQTESTNNE